MQPPVADAGADRLTRQLGTMHKKQQRDSRRRQVTKQGLGFAATGQ